MSKAKTIYPSLYKTAEDTRNGKIHRVTGQDHPSLEQSKHLLLARDDGPKWLPIKILRPTL